MKRCGWAYNDLLIDYHDHVWGKVCHDERQLYKMLVLEGMQAGLSWEIVLKKEKAYEKAFEDFDYEKISKYSLDKENELLEAEGIIKNKRKIHSVIQNAQAFIKIREEFGSFDSYIWSYVNNKQVKHQYIELKEIPAYDELSTRISKDLKKRGFNFVGPTIIYSYLQAIGIYNDHLVDCDFY